MTFLLEVAATSLLLAAQFASGLLGYRWVKAEFAKQHDKLDALLNKERTSVFSKG